MSTVALSYKWTYYHVQYGLMSQMLKAKGIEDIPLGRILGVSPDLFRRWRRLNARPNTVDLAHLYIDFAARYLTEDQMNQCGVTAREYYD